MSLDVYLEKHNPEELFSQNITHNLAEMALRAGIYTYVWQPEEAGIKTAKELIVPLSIGIDVLKRNPEYFKRFDATNGWGRYEHLLPWLEKYLHACKEYPDAIVRASR